MSQVPDSDQGTRENTNLGDGIRRGLLWSSLNAFVLRVGNFAMGIFLARILAPEQFGVFAIALTVQAVLMTLADFGLSTDLIRSPNYKAMEPTVATLGLVTGGALFILMFFSAQPTADLLGNPDAGPVIAVISLSLFLAGLGVVPYAKLQRDFQQKRLFGISALDFIVVNTITIVLVLLGWGVMALAVGRIAAQLCTLIAQFILAGVRPHFGFDKSLAPAIVRFGLPVAAANMLSWLLLNIDNIAISRLAGPIALGFYYLAFNVSNWPMSMIGQVVRSLSLPAFARVVDDGKDRSLGVAVGPVWALGLLAGVMLALLADPVVRLVYGDRWAQSAQILMVLGVFGAFRMLFDLIASYLLAKGRSSTVLVVQLIWLVTLGPALFFWVTRDGSLGAGLAHVAVALVVVIPTYFVALHFSHTDMGLVVRQLLIPVLAAVPTVLVAWLAMNLVQGEFWRLLLGGLVGVLVYVSLLYGWFRRCLRLLREHGEKPRTVQSDLQPQPSASAVALRLEGGK
ncbi:lipopolysaccharide biosynthesis protein [Glutamicibacter sp.]|uniref:lipopolysaccharide biosynthesis protein n=1 Tax=Glutamicibacter sp. TaxID=1931995 RepID=UPI002FE0F564